MKCHFPSCILGSLFHSFSHFYSQFLNLKVFALLPPANFLTCKKNVSKSQISPNRNCETLWEIRQLTRMICWLLSEQFLLVFDDVRSGRREKTSPEQKKCCFIISGIDFIRVNSQQQSPGGVAILPSMNYFWEAFLSLHVGQMVLHGAKSGYEIHTHTPGHS